MPHRLIFDAEACSALARNPSVALIGPRQVGKTTLAGSLLAADSASYFDLKDPQVEAQLAEPMTALKATHRAAPGAASSFAQWSSATCRNSASARPRLPCSASGRCLLTTATARRETQPIRHARLASTKATARRRPIQHSDAPTLTPSMQIALADLVFDGSYAVYPGPRRYRWVKRVEVVPLSAPLGR